ncbi:helix-turn-helix domain-containing protein [Myroides sp. DW712]|uniref:helix-turn-helix domain-containing protein n=1 Tax=Myroides sp. DW712 TaxID=3389800 RepID=UPI00397D81FD
MRVKDIDVQVTNDLMTTLVSKDINDRGQIVLSFCTKGSIAIEVNGQNYSFTTGTMLTLLPQSFVRAKHKTADFTCVHLLFSFRTIDEMILPTNYNFLTRLVEQPVLVLAPEDYLLCEQYIALFLKQGKLSPSVFQYDALRYLLYSLIAHINRVYKQEEQLMQPSTRRDQIVFQFYNLLHQYYLVEKSVGFYADQLKLTPKYLTTLIRQRTGKSISKVIIELVIVKAKTYLTATSWPIYQIAEQLHFADATTFCRYFKTQVGQTPLQYRSNHQ